MEPVFARSFGIDPANGRELRYLQLAAPTDLRAEQLPSAPFVCLVAWHVDRGAIEHVAITLLDAGVSCVSTFGPGCELLHDWIDESLVMRNIERDREDFVMTTWHDKDSQDDVLQFVLRSTAFDEPPPRPMLVLEIGEVFTDRVRLFAALADPVAFDAGYRRLDDDY